METYGLAVYTQKVLGPAVLRSIRLEALTQLNCVVRTRVRFLDDHSNSIDPAFAASHAGPNGANVVPADIASDQETGSKTLERTT